MNPDVKVNVIKGIPLFLVSFYETVTQALPSLILWVTFVYGILQIARITQEMCHAKRERKENEKLTNRQRTRNR